jgi:hypothetical protein
MRTPCLIGVLVLAAATGSSRYRAISRDSRVAEVRRNLAAEALRINVTLQSSDFADIRQAASVLERVRTESGQPIAWIQLRDGSGAVCARAGLPARATFPVEYSRSQLRNRRPVFAVVQTQTGPVLLEVFPVWLPAAGPGPLPARILSVSSGGSQFGMIEIAAHLDSFAAPSARQELPILTAGTRRHS